MSTLSWDNIKSTQVLIQTNPPTLKKLKLCNPKELWAAYDLVPKIEMTQAEKEATIEMLNYAIAIRMQPISQSVGWSERDDTLLHVLFKRYSGFWPRIQQDMNRYSIPVLRYHFMKRSIMKSHAIKDNLWKDLRTDHNWEDALLLGARFARSILKNLSSVRSKEFLTGFMEEFKRQERSEIAEVSKQQLNLFNEEDLNQYKQDFIEKLNKIEGHLVDFVVPDPYCEYEAKRLISNE